MFPVGFPGAPEPPAAPYGAPDAVVGASSPSFFRYFTTAGPRGIYLPLLRMDNFTGFGFGADILGPCSGALVTTICCPSSKVVLSIPTTTNLVPSRSDVKTSPTVGMIKRPYRLLRVLLKASMWSP